MNNAIQITSDGQTIDRTREVLEESVKLLCVIASVKTNRFYIPGETNLVEKLRKKSMESGVFALLSYINFTIKESNPSYQVIRKYIKEKSLNMMDM